MLAEVVREAGRRHGDRPALVSPDGWTCSYAWLDALSDRIAAGLSARGVGLGDVVGLLIPSSVEYVAAYLAAAKVGAITAGVNTRLAPADRAACVDVVGASIVLVAEGLEVGLPVDAPVEVVRLASSAEGVLAGLWGEPLAPRVAPDDDRPVVIVFTSGTTGTPKAAWFTGRQLRAVERMDAADPSAGGVPMLASTELVHVGFMTKLAWYLDVGNTIHLLAKWRAADALEAFARLRMPMIGGIPAQVSLLLREDVEAHDWSHVRAIVAGGGPVSPSLVTEARERFGAPFSVRYSSTESGALGTLTALDAPDDEVLHTVGRPRNGVEVAIRGTDGGDLAPGEEGEVWLRSDAVMSGYWNAPDLTARELRDGWVRMGDLGLIDDAGCLRLVGRRDDVYIRGGYNVHPATVEAALSAHPGVLDVAVVPRPDELMGQVGVAVVVPRDPSDPPTLDDLRTHARPLLARHELPEALELAADLPRTSLHKLDRRALAARHG